MISKNANKISNSLTGTRQHTELLRMINNNVSIDNFTPLHNQPRLTSFNVPLCGPILKFGNRTTSHNCNFRFVVFSYSPFYSRFFIFLFFTCMYECVRVCVRRPFLIQVFCPNAFLLPALPQIPSQAEWRILLEQADNSYFMYFWAIFTFFTRFLFLTFSSSFFFNTLFSNSSSYYSTFSKNTMSSLHEKPDRQLLHRY